MKPTTIEGPHAIIEKDGGIELITGKAGHVRSLAELDHLQRKNRKDAVFMTPFNLMHGEIPEHEQGIAVIEVAERVQLTREQLFELLGVSANTRLSLADGIHPSRSDGDFASSVAEVQRNEIARGNASQVVISREFKGDIRSSDTEASIPHACYRQLLNQRGQYMTMFFSSNESSFVGATPERHLEITPEGQVIMNPIAGTLPKGDRETFPGRLMEFLEDAKEINELCQVLDEEMKMMAAICPEGGAIQGPFLRETGAVVHTEYTLTGRRGQQQPLEALKHTLNAPTLVGSPLLSAADIIKRHEPEGRGHYGGVIGLSRFNKDTNEIDSLDSAIVIRTAKVENDGHFSVRAGAGVVEGSDPDKESQETRRKAEGFTSIFTREQSETAADCYLSMIDPTLLEKKLQARNAHLAKFHFERQDATEPVEKLRGKRVLILDNEDRFSLTLRHMISRMGAEAEVMDTCENEAELQERILSADTVVIGPGPGDINDAENPRMLKLRALAKELTEKGVPTLGVCLGHQALADALGMPVTVQEKPTQGQQRRIDLFGRKEHLGFYNSFSAENRGAPKNLDICADDKGRVMAMRRKGLVGVQFHPESVMSEHGYELLRDYLLELADKELKA